MLTFVRRSAMTIVEVLVALAILAIIAAVVLPTTAGQLRDGHATALANQLASLRDAIGNYRQNVGAYPISLSQLTTQPVAGDDDACATNLSNGELNAWRGPYINQNIVGDMPVGNAVVLVGLTRVTVSGTTGLLRIRAGRVDNDIATQLETQFDGNTNFTTGTILWSAAGDDTLTFQIPVRGC
jgi:prepilin-type N-terminal cleavage/methylation domain-containing protein